MIIKRREFIPRGKISFSDQFTQHIFLLYFIFQIFSGNIYSNVCMKTINFFFEYSQKKIQLFKCWYIWFNSQECWQTCPEGLATDLYNLLNRTPGREVVEPEIVNKSAMLGPIHTTPLEAESCISNYLKIWCEQ